MADQPHPPRRPQRLRVIALASVALLLLIGVSLAMNHAKRQADRQEVLDMVQWARAQMQERQINEAQKTLQKALGIAPDSPEAHLAYGDLQRMKGRWVQASDHYREALRLRPKWVPALLGLGGVALANEADKLAVETFAEVTRQEPGNVDAWIGLGRAHYQQRQRYDKSLEAFRNAARLAPDRTDFFSYYAEALRSTYHFDEVEDVLRKRLSAEPTDVRSRYLLAETLLERQPTPERIAQAERELRTVTRLQPGVPLPHITLGRLLLDRGKPQESIESLKTALRHEPNNREAVTLLARAYRAAGRQKDAEDALAKANRIAMYAEQADRMEATVRQSEDPKVIIEFAELLENAGEIDKADRYRAMAEAMERFASAPGGR